MTIPSGLTNHVEMAYRPGGLGKAMKLLTLLGCDPQSSAQPFNGVLFHFAKNERLWISEVSAEQWAFEQWLERQIGEHGDASSAVFLQRLKAFPQAHGHFGLGTSSLDEWERIIGDLRAAIAEDLEFAAHVSLPIVQRPDDPDSVCGKSGGRMGKTLYQAFLRTDLFSAGLLSLGQTIEIQHYRENDPIYTGEYRALQSDPT